MTSLRVVVADDSVLLREGLVRVLVEAGHEIIGAYGDADALLAEAPALDTRPRRARCADAADLPG